MHLWKKKMRKIFVILGSVLIATGCTHTQTVVKDSSDQMLTCTAMAAQTAEMKGLLRDIDDKTGMSGRNIAMGLFFWPGVIVNQMNAGDARKAAGERLVVLADLAKQKNCP